MKSFADRAIGIIIICKQFGSTRMSDTNSTAELFRMAMRRFATTVSVISTIDSAHKQAMTATAVTSLSMSPPSLLVCIYRTSRFHIALEGQKRFCVNVLYKDQAEISQVFSRPAGPEEYARFGWMERDGFSYLAAAQAAIFCEKTQQVDFGSHTIFIGTVVDATVRDSVGPLIFQNGQYGSYLPLADSVR
jgi:flavin reductase (DIM6/NTAB) family NADH-FMN oxidoreductase RutF